MDYQSPFTVLDDLGIHRKEVHPDNLPKLEKRLLLELELSDGPYLTAGDVQMTKNDILLLFSQLRTAGNLEFHQLLNEDYPKLTRFIRTGEFDERKSIIEKEPDIDDLEGFRQFISPYLIEPVRKRINLYFNQRDFRRAFRLLELTTLLTPEDQINAFDKLAGSINQLLDQIALFASGEVPLDQQNYKFLYHDHFIMFMNELPPEFDAAREKLAIRVNNLGVQYQKKALKFIYMVFMALRALKCSPGMQETILSNSNILEENYLPTEPVAEEIDHDGFSWGSVVGLLFVLFVLIKACAS